MKILPKILKEVRIIPTWNIIEVAIRLGADWEDYAAITYKGITIYPYIHHFADFYLDEPQNISEKEYVVENIKSLFFYVDLEVSSESDVQFCRYFFSDIDEFVPSSTGDNINIPGHVYDLSHIYDVNEIKIGDTVRFVDTDKCDQENNKYMSGIPIDVIFI